jgi:hypothetical protein
MNKFSEESYRMRLSNYLLRNKGKTEIDYLNFEIERAEIYISENNDIEKLEKTTIESFYERNKMNEDDFPYNDALLNVETQGIINIVRKNLYYFKRSNEFHTKKLKLERLLQKEDEFDYANEKDIDKVRFLIEMGLVNYLSKNHFAHSTSSLATALSGVTGIKHSTLKGYLNAYLSTPENKQNPMNDSKKVGVIQMKLKAIGFKKQ